MNESRPAIWATLAAASVGIQVGLATVGSRYALSETDPLTLALLRYGLGLGTLLPLLRSAGLAVRVADGVAMAGLGLLQFGVLILLFNYALLTLPAGRVAVIFSLFPMLTLLLGAALGRERFTAAKFGGAALTVLGVGLALGAGSRVGGGLNISVGWAELAAAAAALCGAVASVFYRPYVVRYGPLMVGAFAMGASVLGLGCVMVALGTGLDVQRLSLGGIAAVVLVGLSSGLAYLALLWAFKSISPMRVTIFQPLAPVTAGLVGWAALGEPLTLQFLVGCGLVGVGIVLAYR